MAGGNGAGATGTYGRGGAGYLGQAGSDASSGANSGGGGGGGAGGGAGGAGSRTGGAGGAGGTALSPNGGAGGKAPYSHGYEGGGGGGGGGYNGNGAGSNLAGNKAALTGGSGGAGGDGSGCGGGGAGGYGAIATDATGATVTNSYNLTGGVGGGGGEGGAYYTGGNGGDGGAGVLFTHGGVTLVNKAAILGGAGGISGFFANGGAGGAGVVGSGLAIDNSSTIQGGAGGRGGSYSEGLRYGAGGGGGAGISDSNATIQNSGKIQGGAAGYGYGSVPSTGAGIVGSYLTIQNALGGVIAGGAGGGGSYSAVAAAAGISGSNISITNSGTIAGGFPNPDGSGRETFALQFTGGANSLTLDGGAIEGGISIAGALTLATDADATLSNIISGAGSLLYDSAGETLTLSAINTLTGGVQIEAGTLDLFNPQAAGSGTIAFAGASAEIEIKRSHAPANTFGGFVAGDKIDIAGLAYNAGVATTVNRSNQLVIERYGVTVDKLQLSGSFSNLYFLAEASADGTEIVAESAPPDPATVVQYLADPGAFDSAVGGFSIRDTAAHVSAAFDTLNSDSHLASIALTNSGVPTLSLTAKQALDDKKALSAITGFYAIEVVDTAKDIEALTPSQIATLKTNGLSAAQATDASLSFDSAQVLAFEKANTKLSAPKGDHVGLADFGSILHALTPAQIEKLSAIGVDQLVAKNSVRFDPSQTAALIAANVVQSALGAATITLTFTGGSEKVQYYNVPGRRYGSYSNFLGSGHAKVAQARNDLDGSGDMLLYASGLTIHDGSGGASATIKVGTDVIRYGAHHKEHVTTGGHGDETFAYTAGFGREWISKFTAKGATHDVLDFRTSMFSYLTPDMTQAQDLAKVLNHATVTGANTTIHDSHGDGVTIEGVSKATLAAHVGDFRFV